ncbi:MAG TPA: tRNA uracil 4-sulfurtransferase ThiI [Nitrososphaerales archaeon]|nr:tRNA uracil 4-sulfurtransferase ThiI [Nitrososphaerales archaeon]
MKATYVVHYSEVALKGKNRPEFIRALRKNLKRILWDLEPEVSQMDGRLVVVSGGNEAEVSQRLRGAFGVAWFSPAAVAERDYQKILPLVIDAARATSGKTFKVEARRSDKTFGMTSHELASKLGTEVANTTGMGVDLTSPDVVLHVDVTKGSAVVYSNKRRGPGGLPVGTSGRVLHLFSGGIDSPVAAWLLMKRGCVPVYLHFYLAPTVDFALDSKISRLVRTLAAYGGKSTLVMAPFAEYQLATSGARGELEPSLFRRFMRMTAEALVPAFGASAISTGDSLSQAASQTLWNIAAFDQGALVPILRPLLTYDKEEIVTLAKQISTYDLSLEEYKDCCAIITRHPRTRVRAGELSDEVRSMDLQNLVWRVLEEATLVTYNPVGGVTKASPLGDAMAEALPLKGARADL